MRLILVFLTIISYNIAFNVQVVITNERTLSHLTDKREKLLDSAVKVNYVLLEHFKYMFNVTIAYHMDYCGLNVLQPQEKHIEKQLVEDCVTDKLLTRNVDITTYPLLLSKEKLEILDFPALAIPGTPKFIFRQPKLSYMTNVYTLPFNANVWWSSLVLVVLLTLILYAVVKWEWYTHRRTNTVEDLIKLHDTELSDSFLEASFVTIGAICQQGSDKSTSTIPGRIVIWFLFMSLMFLFTSYSANIVALLQSSSTDIETFQDLQESPLEIGIDETYRDHLSGEKWYYVNCTVGLDKVRKEMFAFHVETSSAYTVVGQTFAEDEKCGLQEVQLLPYPTDLYFPVSKGSGFRQMFRVGFLKLKETGIQNRELALIYNKKPKCWTTDTTFVSIGLTDCYFVVAILAGGVAFALVIFLIEQLNFKLVRLTAVQSSF